MNALFTDDPILTSKIQSASSDTLRKLVVELTRLVIKRSGLVERRIDQAIRMALAGKIDQVMYQKLEALAEKYDNLYFAKEDLFERGKVTHEDVVRCFARARAASTAISLMEEDPKQGAALAIFEASEALDDWVEVSNIANELLDQG